MAAAVEVHCPACGSNVTRRLEREGVRENYIYPLFGYYPWRCRPCRKKFFRKLRYRSEDESKNYVR